MSVEMVFSVWETWRKDKAQGEDRACRKAPALSPGKGVNHMIPGTGVFDKQMKELSNHMSPRCRLTLH